MKRTPNDWIAILVVWLLVGAVVLWWLAEDYGAGPAIVAGGVFAFGAALFYYLRRIATALEKRDKDDH